MKIEAITEDSKTISQHFGCAPYYLVATVENNKIIDRGSRDKLGHAQLQKWIPLVGIVMEMLQRIVMLAWHGRLSTVEVGTSGDKLWKCR